MKTNMTNPIARLLLLFACLSIAANFERSACAQSTSALLSSAKQLANSGELLDSTNLLHKVLGDKLVNSDRNKVLSPDERSALRLLSENYAASGDSRQAVEFGQRYLAGLLSGRSATSATLAPDRINTRILLAESYSRLGQASQARRHLLAASHELLSSNSLRSYHRLQQQARLLRAYQLIGKHPNDPAVFKTLANQFDTISLGDFPEEHRFRAVRIVVDNLLARKRPDEAIQVLDRVGLVLPETKGKLPEHDFFRYEELSELFVLKARCLRARDATLSASADWRYVMATIHLLSENQITIKNRLTKARSAEALIALGATQRRLGDLYEWLADLSLQGTATKFDLSQEYLTKAAISYRNLCATSEILGKLHGRMNAWSPRAAEREALASHADNYQDVALAGLQRILLHWDGSQSSSFKATGTTLTAASKALVKIRQRRLMPGDPALIEAQTGLAFVHASEDRFNEAIEVFQSLSTNLNAQSPPDHFAQSQAALGLGVSLLGARLPQEAKHAALSSQKYSLLLEKESPNIAALLAPRIQNILGFASLATGDYESSEGHLQKADKLLKILSDADGEVNVDAVHSKTKLFFAFLKKAEAKYVRAKSSIAEGRLINHRLPSAGVRHQAVYDLIEASVLLSEARDKKMSGDSLEESLRQSHVLIKKIRTDIKGRKDRAAFDEHLAILEATEYSLKGDKENAQKTYRALTSQNGIALNVRARAYLRLSRLEMQNVAVPKASGGHDAYWKSQQLYCNALRDALSYADQANDALRALADSQAYPSLRFQTLSESARLNEALMHLESSLWAKKSSSTQTEEMVSFYEQIEPTEWASRIGRSIAQLEEAIGIAERPATQSTQRGLNRSRFFTRFAPSYDRLVGLYVQQAIPLDAANGKDFITRQGEASYKSLLNAIRVADLARNRTFREEIHSWQGEDSEKNFDLNQSLSKVVGPDEGVLVYHLGGMRWKEDRRLNPQGGSDGRGHLFVLLNRGAEIHYFPLTIQENANQRNGGSINLSRSAAANLVGAYVAELAKSPAQRKSILSSQRSLARQCTEAILPPRARELISPDRISRLTIFPDGALHQLPFEALVVKKKNGNYGFAIEEALPPITYGPSLSVLASIEASEEVTHWQKVVSVGGLDYAADSNVSLWKDSSAWNELSLRTRTDRLEPLLYAPDECRQVIRAFHTIAPEAKQTYIGQEATESTFRSAVVSANFVHIAAHAIVDHQGDNLYGAIVLRPEDSHDPDRDGFVHLSELYSMDFSECELAVLSACKTLVGANRPLEAGMSLARALLERHARRVVSSHWSISDHASADLVVSFCTKFGDSVGIGAPIDYAKALRDAKLDLLKSKEWKDPYFWAPLVLVGAR